MHNLLSLTRSLGLAVRMLMLMQILILMMLGPDPSAAFLPSRLATVPLWQAARGNKGFRRTVATEPTRIADAEEEDEDKRRSPGIPGRIDVLEESFEFIQDQRFFRDDGLTIFPIDLFQPNSNDPKHHNFKEEEEESNDRPRLELTADGVLRMGQGGACVLEGLSSSTWSAVPGDDGDSVFLRAVLGAPQAEHKLALGNLASCHRLLACARLNRYWMGPAFGNSSAAIPTDTQFLLVELDQNHNNESDSDVHSPGEPLYALLLPMVDAGFRATLKGEGEKSLGVVCHSEFGDDSTLPGHDGTMRALYAAVGDDPFRLLQEGFRKVSEQTGTFKVLDQKALPDSVNDFGWCTWDAFYSKVTPRGILEGVKALSDAGVPPRNVILDDGWQIVHPEPKGWKSLHETCTKNDPAMPAPRKAPKQDNFLTKYLINPIIDWVAKAATDYYVAKVEGAPHGSIHNRIWTFLAKTILKQGLWDFFDSQTDFARQLDGFEPNAKFENHCGEAGVGSLKELVSSLKEDLGVKHIYCWHAIHGYWRGISTELGQKIGIDVTQVHPQPTEHMLKLEPQAEFDPPSLFGVGVIQKEDDLATFYKHIHAPLLEAGIDGVKVDVQSGVTAAGSGIGDGSRIARLYTQAMEASVSQHFPATQSASGHHEGDGETGPVNCINCMCHSTENLYRYKTTAVARASEDFFPDKPESHSVHLVNVAYNSLFLGEICLPDWDMFHSKHASAALHAAARAIGGCPVYVSDVPGQHDPALLRKLVLPDGSILRSQLPGRPTRDCLFADVGQDQISALKIWNQHKAGGGGVVGAFHVQGVAWNFRSNKNDVLEEHPAPLTAFVRPFDVELLRRRGARESTSDKKDSYAVWKYRDQSLHVLKDGADAIETPLEHREWEIHTIVPIQRTESVQWAPIGLGEMMNSGGSLESAGSLEQSTSSGRRSTTVDFRTRGPGRFVAYCQPAPSSIMINDGDLGSLSSLVEDFTHDREAGLLSFELPLETHQAPHQLTVVWDL